MRFWNIFLAFLNFVKTIYAHRSVLGMMARQEIKNRYAGTLAGLLWSFINPLMMILVYWFVFSVGFKIQPPGGYPFILVFLCGLVPWTLLSETLMSSSNVVIKNPHLVKKIAFPTEILPFVNLATSLITHGIMLVILIIIMLVNSVPLSWINLQFIYYLFALSVFITGLSWRL